MPNGDHHEFVPIWKQVKDMQINYRGTRLENEKLRDKIKDLEAEKASLLETVRMLKDGDK